MIEGGVGVPWRTDGDNGEIQVVDGVGGDRGGNWIILPSLVRCTNKDSSSDETKTDNTEPNNLGRPGLKIPLLHGENILLRCRYVTIKYI